MRKVCLGGAAIVALALAGCQTVSFTSRPAEFSYEAGTASQMFDSTANQVETAALEAMADLKMSSVRKFPEGSRTTFHGLTADGRRATVSVSRVLGLEPPAINPVETQPVVTVRIGWLGDEPLSRALMDRISIRLGSSAPSAIPSEPPSEPEKPVIFGAREVNPPSVRRLSDSGYRDTPVP